MEKSANYIHNQFITNGPSWIKKTWNWLTQTIMGKSSDYTLVDVFADVFSGVSTAISKVKDVANQALNAVKAGLQYIANAVLALIYASIATGVNFFISSLFLTFDALINEVSYDGSANIPTLNYNGNQFQLGLDSYFGGIDLFVGSEAVRFKSPLFNPSVETLGIGDFLGLSDVQINLLTKLGLIEAISFPVLTGARYLYNTPDPRNHAIAAGLVTLSMIAQGISEIFLLMNAKSSFNNNNDEFKEVIELSAYYHLGLAFGMLMWFNKVDIFETWLYPGLKEEALPRFGSSWLIPLILTALGLSFNSGQALANTAFDSNNLVAQTLARVSFIGIGALMGVFQTLILSKNLQGENVKTTKKYDIESRDTFSHINSVDAMIKNDAFSFNLMNLIDLEGEIIFIVKLMVAYHIAMAIALGLYWRINS